MALPAGRAVSTAEGAQHRTHKQALASLPNVLVRVMRYVTGRVEDQGVALVPVPRNIPHFGRTP